MSNKGDQQIMSRKTLKQRLALRAARISKRSIGHRTGGAPNARLLVIVSLAVAMTFASVACSLVWVPCGAESFPHHSKTYPRPQLKRSRATRSENLRHPTGRLAERIDGVEIAAVV